MTTSEPNTLDQSTIDILALQTTRLSPQARADLVGFVRSNLELDVLCDQLAEEASELAQAALKLSRSIRKKNPTPVSINEAYDNLVEEYTDVMLASDAVDVHLQMDIYDRKLKRWIMRLEEKNEPSI